MSPGETVAALQSQLEEIWLREIRRFAVGLQTLTPNQLACLDYMTRDLIREILPDPVSTVNHLVLEAPGLNTLQIIHQLFSLERNKAGVRLR